MIKIEINENSSGQRIDRFLRKYFKNAPLSYIYKLIRKDVKIDGKRVGEEYVLKAGDVITLYIPEEQSQSLMGKAKKTAYEGFSKAKRQFKIAYEDDDIIIVDKPFGLLTHGTETEKKDHLANQVVDYLIETGSYVPRLEKTFTPAPANRLDRNTTGLVVFGKTAEAGRRLAEMFREHDSIRKFYLTIVEGEVSGELVLDDELEGQRAETVARPLKVGRVKSLDGKDTDVFTLLEVEIMTGRTHQIRKHLSEAGHPLLGDIKYGGKRAFGQTTQLLHSSRLVLGDPYNVDVISEVPETFLRVKKSIFK